MKEFYLTLISNSSNNISSFTVQFPHKIVVGEGSLVGLAEVQYSYNFFNITENNSSFKYVCNDFIYDGSIRVGFYKSVDKIVKEITKQTDISVIGLKLIL